jgi:transposase InsO family protein
MTGPKERQALITLIDQATTAGARLGRACATAGIDRKTYHRWHGQTGQVQLDRRPTAVRPTPDNALWPQEREAILAYCAQPRFADLPPSQIVPTLADEGIYLASESSFYRVLHAAKQQHARGRARRPNTATLSSHHASKPNQLWSWDVTWLPTSVRGQFYYLYMIVDVWSRKIVGWEVNDRETGELAADLVNRATLAERCHGTGLVLHADNGAPQKSSTLRVTLDRLGIRCSFSRPRVSDDNPYSEALFRTTKYRPDYPVDGFPTLEAARQWVLAFVRWYNTEHHHSAIAFVTPSQRHDGRDIAILEQRQRLYEEAKLRNQSRWSRSTRNWQRPAVVSLNPERRNIQLKDEKLKIAA